MLGSTFSPEDANQTLATEDAAAETEAMLNATTANYNTTMEAAIYFTPRTLTTAQFATYITLIIIGILSNLLNIRVLDKLQKTVFYTCLKGVAVYDFLFLVIVGYNIYYLKHGYYSSYSFCWVHTKITLFLFNTFAGGSSLLLVAISIFRLAAVRFPLYARVSATVYRARLTIVLALVVSAILRSPFITLFAPFEITLGPNITGYLVTWSPFYHGLGQELYLAMGIIFDYIIPISLFFLNLGLFLSYKRSQSIRRRDFEDCAQSDVSRGESANESRLTLVLMSIVTLSIIGNFPATISRYLNLSIAMRHIFAQLFIFDHCANFFLYSVTNADFRQAMFEMLGRTTKQQPGLAAGSTRRSAKGSTRSRTETADDQSATSRPNSEYCSQHI